MPPCSDKGTGDLKIIWEGAKSEWRWKERTTRKRKTRRKKIKCLKDTKKKKTREREERKV